MGKKVTTLDDRFLKAAMGALSDEFSIALDIPADQAEEMIREAIHQ
jgi:hypothetical protein